MWLGLKHSSRVEYHLVTNYLFFILYFCDTAGCLVWSIVRLSELLYLFKFKICQKQCTHFVDGSRMRIPFVSWKQPAKISFHINDQPETKELSHKLGNTNILIYGILSAKNRKSRIFCSLIWLIAIKLKMWTIVWCTGTVLGRLLSSLPLVIESKSNCDQAKWYFVFKGCLLKNDFIKFCSFLTISGDCTKIFAVPCLLFFSKPTKLL